MRRKRIAIAAAIAGLLVAATWAALAALAQAAENRGGHGMPRELLLEEMVAAGFEVVCRIDDWRGRER